ncbi:hypothetical protein Q1695_015566 [Nippostrongylus brasiliensis]|nr:hypothetical protein Q1695_015566 [Nippostrongylus brasiliensis]
MATVPPSDINTQPNARIVFNAPYNDKHTYPIKIFNGSGRRIGWAIKTTNTNRLGVDPTCGVFDLKKATGDQDVCLVGACMEGTLTTAFCYQYMTHRQVFALALLLPSKVRGAELGFDPHDETAPLGKQLAVIYHVRLVLLQLRGLKAEVVAAIGQLAAVSNQPPATTFKNITPPTTELE